MADRVVFSGGRLQLETGGPVPPEAFPGSEGGEANELVSRGDGAPLVVGKEGVALLLRSLAQGDGIHLEVDGDVVRISATISAQDIIDGVATDVGGQIDRLRGLVAETAELVANHEHDLPEAPPDHVLTGQGWVPLAAMLPEPAPVPDVDLAVQRAVAEVTPELSVDLAALRSIAERARVSADVKSLSGIGGHLTALYRLIGELAEALGDG